MAKQPPKKKSTSDSKAINIKPEKSIASDNRTESLRKLEATANEIEVATRTFIGQSSEQQYVAALENAISRINQNMAQMQQKSATQAFTYSPAGTTQKDGCCTTQDCVSPDCCKIEFVFKKARMTAGQTGVDATYDGETSTGLAGARSGMEIQFFASLDGVGIIEPNQIWRYIQLEKRVNRPGVWYDVDRVVREVYVPCNGTKTFTYSLQAVEREIGQSEVLLGKDEYGATSGSVRMTCCDSGPIPLIVPLDLAGGGRGRGEVEVMFEIRRA